MRALLSVYDKSGIVDLGRGLHDLGWELVSSSNTARALREAGLPVTEVADVTGSGRDARPPGGDVAPEHPRRAARRPRQPRARRGPRAARHHADRPRRVEPLPVRRASRRRDDRHRRPGDGPRRGEEPRARRRRGRSRPITTRCSTSCVAKVRSRWRRGARSRARRSRTRPRTTRPSPRGSATATMCFRRRCR